MNFIGISFYHLQIEYMLLMYMKKGGKPIMSTESQLYEEEIVTSLKEGRASVFVGAGFSLNADPINDQVKAKMPLWNDLLDEFCDKLGYKNEDMKYTDSLDIAQDMADVYGRLRLDQMIQESMNDRLFKPSDVHKLLMELPWNNVFTTNYDTLLDRTCDIVNRRQYKIIHREEDLVLYDSNVYDARLIKLHGSFDTQHPYIFTQEDYRTYPRKHSIFVNTVQQALIENTLCLIGFSASDPNFLRWIGWIHDNLGLDQSPNIYLITHEKMNDVRKKRLNKLKIEVVNISEMHNGKDTRSIYKAFLGDINQRVYTSDILTHDLNNWADISFSDLNANHDMLLKLESMHSHYPGWILLPKEKIRVVEGIITDVGYALQNAQQNLDTFLIIYEFCWLNDISGKLIGTNLLEVILDVLKSYDEEICTDHSLYQKYIYVICVLLKHYRIYNCEDKWVNTHRYILICHEELSNDLRNKLIYEEIMHELYSLNYQNLNEKIYSIQIDNYSNEWALRKASFLVMIGQIGEARTLIIKSLNSVRLSLKKLNVNKLKEYNYYYQSLESCLMSFAQYLNGSFVYEKGNFEKIKDCDQSAMTNRLHDDFNWPDEFDYYSNALEKANEDKNGVNGVYEKINFDIYKHTTVMNFNDNYFNDAIAFLLFREETGIPFMIGRQGLSSGFEEAMKRLVSINPNLPCIYACLCGRKEIITTVYSRNVIQSFSIKYLDQFNMLFKKAIQVCHEGIAIHEMNDYETNANNNYLLNSCVKVLPELIGRFSVKVSNDQFPEILSIMKGVYWTSEDPFVDYDELPQMIYAMPVSFVIDQLKDFTNLAVNFSSRRENILTYIVRSFLQYNIDNITLEDSLVRFSGKIFEDLKNKAGSGEGERKQVIQIIINYSKIIPFTEEQKTVIWEMIFNVKEKIDSFTNNMNLIYLQFPISKKEEFEEKLMKTFKELHEKFGKYIDDMKEELMIPQNLIEDLWKYSRLNEFLSSYEISEQNKEKIKIFQNSMIDNVMDIIRVLNQIDDYLPFFNTKKNALETCSSIIVYSDVQYVFKDNETEISIISEIFKENDVPCCKLDLLEITDDDKKYKYVIDRLTDDKEIYQRDAYKIIRCIMKSETEKKVNLNDPQFQELFHCGKKYQMPYVNYSVKAIIIIYEKMIKEHNDLDEATKNKVNDLLETYMEYSQYNDEDSDSLMRTKILLRKSLYTLAYELHRAGDLDDKIYKDTFEHIDDFAEAKNAWVNLEYIDQLKNEKDLIMC